MAPGSASSSPPTLSGEQLSALNAIRCKRGRALFRARHRQIVRVGEHEYRVPSQHDGGLYNVCLKPSFEHCSCPDFARYGDRSDVQSGTFACKHLYAALMLQVKSAREPARAEAA